MNNVEKVVEYINSKLEQQPKSNQIIKLDFMDFKPTNKKYSLEGLEDFGEVTSCMVLGIKKAKELISNILQKLQEDSVVSSFEVGSGDINGFDEVSGYHVKINDSYINKNDSSQHSWDNDFGFFNEEDARDLDVDYWTAFSQWTFDMLIAFSLKRNPEVVTRNRMENELDSNFTREYKRIEKLIYAAIKNRDIKNIPALGLADPRCKKIDPIYFIEWAKNKRIINLPKELVDEVRRKTKEEPNLVNEDLESLKKQNQEKDDKIAELKEALQKNKGGRPPKNHHDIWKDLITYLGGDFVSYAEQAEEAYNNLDANHDIKKRTETVLVDEVSKQSTAGKSTIKKEIKPFLEKIFQKP